MAGVLVCHCTLAGEVADALRNVESDGQRAVALEALNGAELSELFDVLAQGTLPLPGMPAEGHDFGTRTAAALSDLQHRCLLEALAARPPAALRHSLMSWVTQEDSLRVRRAALNALALNATASDLDHAVDLVQGRLPRLAHEFEALVSRLFADDPRSYARLRAELATDDEDLRAALIRGIGASRNARGLALLNSFLFDGCPQLDVFLEGIGSLAESVSQGRDLEVIRDSVRHLIFADEPRVAAAAIRATAALEDTASIPDLITLLDSDSSRVSNCAKLALSSITGFSFATPRRWQLWYDAEREWWDTRWPTVASALRTATRDTIVSLLSETIGRRLEHELLVVEVVALLGHEDPHVRSLACLSLGQMQAKTAIPALLTAMAAPEEAVARNAWQALRTITGIDLPFDPDACSHQLQEPQDR